MATRREIPRALPAALALVGIVALVYVPALRGDVLFQRDVGRLLYPVRWFVSGALARGEWPWWNPYEALGASAFIDPQYGLFYPPNAILALVPAGVLPQALTLFLLAHALAGGVGFVSLGRRLGMSASGALVAGLAWCLSGFVTSEFTAGYRLIGAAWMPWCALAFMATLAPRPSPPVWRVRPGRLVWAALAVAAPLLAGEPFVAMMDVGFALALCAVYGATSGAASLPADGSSAVAAAVAPAGAVSVAVPAPTFAPAGAPGAVAAGGATVRVVVRAAVPLVVAMVLGVLLAMPALLPAMRAAAQTSRAAPLPRQEAEQLSFHPLRAVELVAPGAMGQPYLDDYPGGRWVGEAGAGDRPLVYGVYLGGGVLALAALAFGRRRRETTALAILACFALCLALGRHLPVHGAFRLLVLPFAYMRSPEKYLLWVVALVALLAGFGATRLVSGERGLVRRAAVALAMLAGLALAAPIFPGGLERFVRAGAIQAAAAAAVVLAAAWLAPRRPAAAAALLVVAVAVDLAAAAWPLQTFADASLLTTRPASAGVLLADARSREPSDAPPRVYRAPDVDAAMGRLAPPRTLIDVEVNLLVTLIDNSAATYGIGSVPGYTAASTTALQRVLRGAGPVTADALRLLGVAYAVLPVGPPGGADAREGAGFTRIADPHAGARLYRIEGVLPRLHLAGAALPLADEVAAQAVRAPEIARGERAIIAPGPGADGLPSRPGVAGRCGIDAFTATRIEARCTAERDALAVFVEQYDPGWRAEVDGVAAPLLRTNLVMRGVRVAAGEHRIVLRFTPPGLAAGLALAAGAAALLLGGVVLGAAARRRRS